MKKTRSAWKPPTGFSSISHFLSVLRRRKSIIFSVEESSFFSRSRLQKPLVSDPDVAREHRVVHRLDRVAGARGPDVHDLPHQGVHRRAAKFISLNEKILVLNRKFLVLNTNSSFLLTGRSPGRRHRRRPSPLACPPNTISSLVDYILRHSAMVKARCAPQHLLDRLPDRAGNVPSTKVSRSGRKVTQNEHRGRKVDQNRAPATPQSKNATPMSPSLA